MKDLFRFQEKLKEDKKEKNMSIKIVFYLKGNRTVTLTDDEEKSLSTIKDQIMNVIKKDNFCSFVTKTDSITLKPTEIVGFHLLDSSRSKDRNFSNVVENDFDYDFRDIIEEIPKENEEKDSKEEESDISLFQIMNEDLNEESSEEIEELKRIEEKDIPNIEIEDDVDFDLGEFISDSSENQTENIYLDNENQDDKIKNDAIEEKEDKETIKKKEKKSNVKINKGNLDRKGDLIQQKELVNRVSSGVALTNTAESIQQIIGKEDMLKPPTGNNRNNPLEVITDPKLRKFLEQQTTNGNLKINTVVKK